MMWGNYNTQLNKLKIEDISKSIRFNKENLSTILRLQKYINQVNSIVHTMNSSIKSQIQDIFIFQLVKKIILANWFYTLHLLIIEVFHFTA